MSDMAKLARKGWGGGMLEDAMGTGAFIRSATGSSAGILAEG